MHPYARIDSSVGPVNIGESAVVWEKAVVGVLAEGEGEGQGDDREGSDDKGVNLERYVTIGSGAVVAATLIGEGSVIGTGARLGKGCVLGEVCQIRAANKNSADEYVVLPCSAECRLASTYASAGLHCCDCCCESTRKLAETYRHFQQRQ